MEEKNNLIPDNEEQNAVNNQEENSLKESTNPTNEAIAEVEAEPAEKPAPEKTEKKAESDPPSEATEEETGEESIAKEFQQVEALEQKMASIAAEQDEDDDEAEEDENDNEAEDYSAYSIEELINHLSIVLEGDDFNAFKRKVALIKSEFLKKMMKLKDSLEIDSQSENEEAKKISFDQKEMIRNFQNRFDGYFQIYKEKKKAYFENLEKQKQENLSRKHSILAEMKELLDSNAPLKEIDDDFNRLKDSFREIRLVPKESLNDLWRTFHFYQERFFDKIKINRELRDLGLAKNLEKKIKLCEQTEELLLEKSPQKAFKKLQEYHTKWKEIGAVPSDKRDELWERFKMATEKIHDIRHAYYEQFKEREEESYRKKLELCERIEEEVKKEWNSFKDWNKQGELINEIFNEWKTLGRAPKEVNDQVWERFRNSIDLFYQNKKEYFNKVKTEQKDNLNKKVELCVQAEALQDSTDWKHTTKALIDLQKKWKETGSVPRKHSEKIWKRFRAACDIFFNNKAEHFAGMGDSQQENLKAKQAIIERLKSFDSKNSKESINMLKEIQKEWSDIGHVPYKIKDTIYQEYRDLLNNIYDKLNVSRQEMANQNFKERFEQMADTAHGKQDIKKERRFLVNKLRQMEDDIKVWENNLGFFSRSKGAQKMKEEFEKKIQRAKKDVDGLKERIRILSDLS
jgi:hypothetical protein